MLFGRRLPRMMNLFDDKFAINFHLTLLHTFVFVINFRLILRLTIKLCFLHLETIRIFLLFKKYKAPFTTQYLIKDQKRRKF